MRIEVMSRNKFETYMAQNHKMTSIVVSISAIGENAPVVLKTANNGIIGALILQFNDVANPDSGYGGITEEQAIGIAEFISSGIGIADKIIVHCGAGQSRSAGVAAAILKYYTGSDLAIYNNPMYTPNNLCYRRVLKALIDIKA